MFFRIVSTILGAILAISLCVGRVALAQQTVVFVNDTATGANDGDNWTDAYVDLQDALDEAAGSGGSSIEEIWVAGGTYRPSALTDRNDDRSATFAPRAGLELYGGFFGNETAVSEREIIRNPTYLDGLIPASTPYNVYHVVTASTGTQSFGFRLDGFIIRNGVADGTGTDQDIGGGLVSPDLTRSIVANCVFKDNHAETRGGGAYAVYNDFGSHLQFVNCFFDGNTCAQDGAGLSAQVNEADWELTNCVFFENEAEGSGGGFHQTGNNTLLIRNCTFVENVAGRGGGGVSSASNANLRNSILYYNVADGETDLAAQLEPGTSSSSVQYCCMPGITETNGNIDDAPAFANQSAGNLRLSNSSPCVDAGVDGEIPADEPNIDLDADFSEPIPLDIDLVPRQAGSEHQRQRQRHGPNCRHGRV